MQGARWISSIQFSEHPSFICIHTVRSQWLIQSQNVPPTQMLVLVPLRSTKKLQLFMRDRSTHEESCFHSYNPTPASWYTVHNTLSHKVTRESLYGWHIPAHTHTEPPQCMGRNITTEVSHQCLKWLQAAHDASFLSNILINATAHSKGSVRVSSLI